MALASRASEAPAIKVLIAACAEPNRIEWAAEIQRTEDFVVYPVAFELGSLKRNLKACVPPEGLKKVESFLKSGELRKSIRGYEW